ncbi:BCCT family transporter, partial [Pseudomonas aeruginosa]
LNIVLFSSLLLFVLVCGSTLELLNGFVQNLGDYLDGLVLKTFDLYVYTGAGTGVDVEVEGLQHQAVEIIAEVLYEAVEQFQGPTANQHEPQ